MTVDEKKRIYPMNALQWDMYEDACQCPTMTGFNVTVCVDVPCDKCSPERMLKACQDVLDNQRYFHIHLLMSADGEPQVCEDGAMPNTEEQLNTFARLIGEYALKLASTDTAATVGDIMNSCER